MTSEEQQPDEQNKNNTAPDNDKEVDDKSYEDNDMFSKDDYEGFAFVQYVTCNMNDKAGISYSQILLDSQSTIRNIHE